MQLYMVNRPLILQHQATRSRKRPGLRARQTHYVGRLRQHGCEAATMFFFFPFFERVMRDEVCLDFQTEQGRAAGRMLLK